jgi:uncharacterized protein YjdB
MDVPAWVLSYNGKDDIKDANNAILTAFQKEVSYTSYLEGLWKYWGKFEKVDIPYKTPWIEGDTVTDGWDWSLPDFVEADSLAYFRYKNTPNLDFSSKNLNDVYVRWNELEPTEGEYNFEYLRQLIIDNSKGYDGVSVRVLASVWTIDSYPDPGGYVPTWLKDRKNAPRWMENYDVAKIQAHKAIDGKYIITNMDIMNPEYHSRYLKFLDEFGKSGIPQMDQIKIFNVCYRSASAGEEFTAYNPDYNAVEASYSPEIIAQRTKERLDGWAAAFGDQRHKLMYVGHDEKAQIEHAGELGIGSRNGFIEMYNSYVHMPQFGITIHPATRYGQVDEENPFIKKDVAFGDENEEYDNELRFGWKESFAYRYYVSSFRMLQMRRNYVMHAGNTLNPELTWYVGMGLARKVEDTPDAWAMLSEYYLSSFANEGNAGPAKNIERWLYQRDLPGYETTPAIKVPTAKDLWFADNTKPYDFTARKGKKMAFNVDDRLFPKGEQSMAIKVSFYDGVAGSLKLVYENDLGIQEDSVVTTGIDQVRTATFFITARMDTSLGEQDSLSHDFELHSEAEVPVFFVRVIKTKNQYINTDQQPYGGTMREIPGLIECENYDEGEEGFAFHDDGTKQGDLSQRPADNVDIIASPTAGNGYVIAFTEEGEWLEYTVDATPGKMDITLYYYCGETAGDLLVSLDGQALDTIGNILNNGWDQLDSVTVRQMLIPGGSDRILRLEFVNGAGFHIDKIKFSPSVIPVSGVSITNCAQEAMIAGDTLRLETTVIPEDAADPSIVWSSSDNSVAIVDENGLISAVAGGEATITASTNDQGFTAMCEIEVMVPVTGISIDNCPGEELVVDSTYQLLASVQPPEARDSSVSWSSSNPTVAIVNENGLLTGLSQGTTTITATTADGRYAQECTITISSNVSGSGGMAVTGINIYPNPVKDILYVKFPEMDQDRIIRVYDICGKMMLTMEASGHDAEIDIDQLNTKGLILVHIISDLTTEFHKIVIDY